MRGGLVEFLRSLQPDGAQPVPRGYSGGSDRSALARRWIGPEQGGIASRPSRTWLGKAVAYPANRPRGALAPPRRFRYIPRREAGGTPGAVSGAVACVPGNSALSPAGYAIPRTRRGVGHVKASVAAIV